MDFYSKDLEAWISEAQSDPHTAAQIITALTGRVTQLQAQNDALLAETLMLKRASGGAYLEQIERLRAGITDIKSWAIRQNLERQTILAASFTGEVLQFVNPQRSGRSAELIRTRPERSEPEQTFSLKTSDEKPLADLRPIHLAPASNLGQALFVSSSFRAQIFGCVGLPAAITPDWQYATAPPLPMLKRGERIEAITVSDEFGRANALTLVTRRGFARTLPWLMVENLIAAGHPLIKPAVDDDAPVHVSECFNNDLLVVTRLGKWLRFPLNSLEASGAAVFALDAGDDVACAAEIAPDKPLVCFVSDSGAMLAVSNAGLEAHQKPGAKPGNLPRGFRPVACFAADEAASLLTLSRGGELDLTPVNRIPAAARLSEAKLFSLFSQRVIGAACFSLKQ